MVVEHPFSSGTFAEVLELEIRDYGGNVLWSGPISSWHPKRVSFKIPTRRVATKLGKLSGCISDKTADFAE